MEFKSFQDLYAHEPTEGDSIIIHRFVGVFREDHIDFPGINPAMRINLGFRSEVDLFRMWIYGVCHQVHSAPLKGIGYVHEPITTALGNIQARNAGLLLYAYADNRVSPVELKPGTPVYPDYSKPDCVFHAGYKPSVSLRPMWILDKQGTKYLLLRADGTTMSATADHLLGLKYRPSVQEIKELWDKFDCADVWRGQLKFDFRDEPSKPALKPKPPRSIPKSLETDPFSIFDEPVKKPLPKNIRHYYQLSSDSLKHQDQVYLFERYILRIQNFRFDDQTVVTEPKYPYWFQAVCYKIPRESYGIGPYRDVRKYIWENLAPQSKADITFSLDTVHKFDYNNLKDATALSRLFLAISDEAMYWPTVSLRNGMHLIKRPMSSNQHITLWETVTVESVEYYEGIFVRAVVVDINGHRMKTALKNHWIPVALNKTEFDALVAAQAGLPATFIVGDQQDYSKPQTNNDHELQTTADPSGQREQKGETNRAVLQEGQTRLGSGYSGNRVRPGRSQGQTRSCPPEGTPQKFRSPGSKTRSNQPGTGPEGTPRRVQGTVRGRGRGNPADHGSVIDEWFSCSECKEDAVVCLRHHSGIQSGIYMCVECGYQESFP